MTNSGRPLEGIRVIEMGQLLAGPFTGTVLAYFGAEVIKIEPPEGDPIRGWRLLHNGTSLWYRSLGRNKKSVTLDLKAESGRQLAGRLIDTADVLIENFRPGLMESWGLGPDDVKATNPGLVYARISGMDRPVPLPTSPAMPRSRKAMAVSATSTVNRARRRCGPTSASGTPWPPSTLRWVLPWR